jgi:regulator of extracellular matrix RemA (YlzA/DUF370 family)
MPLKVLSVGFDNAVSADRVIAVVTTQTAPIKRMIDEARKKNKLVDATNGRKTKSAIITDSDHVVLSAMQPSTIIQRISGK